MTYKEVPIAKIKPNPRQLGKVFDEEKLEELAASIRRVGLIQPVLLRPKGQSYELVHGERRLRPARLRDSRR